MRDELTEAEMRRIEARWKSDVDLKLDALTKSVALLQCSISELNSVLATGKGGVALLFLSAKIMAAISVIAGGVYAAKKWILA